MIIFKHFYEPTLMELYNVLICDDKKITWYDFAQIVEIFYTMVKTKSAYDASKVGQDEKELLKRKIERTQKALEKLNAKLSDAA